MTAENSLLGKCTNVKLVKQIITVLFELYCRVYRIDKLNFDKWNNAENYYNIYPVITSAPHAHLPVYIHLISITNVLSIVGVA